MENLKEIQDAVNRVYLKHFFNFDWRTGFSCPFVPRISPQYLEENNRVVILGQETNTWYRNENISNPDFSKGDVSEIEIHCLQERFDKFVEDDVETYKKSKFWLFSSELYTNDILEGTMVTKMNGKKYLSHCWLNLFLVEKIVNKGDDKGKTSQNRVLTNEVLSIQKQLLYEIFEIIKPKVIVALIGPDIDGIFTKYALNVQVGNFEIIKVSNEYEKRILAEFRILDNSNCLNNTKIIRAYHPSYFMWRMKKKYMPDVYKNALMNKIRCVTKNN